MIMFANDYTRANRIRLLRRDRVYKEKLKDLHSIEYDKPELKDNVREIPRDQVEKTLLKLAEQRPEKERKRRIRNLKVILICIAIFFGVIQLFALMVKLVFS